MEAEKSETPKATEFVAELVKDPKMNPDLLFLTGFLGASSEEGHARLYFDVQLSAWIEIPNEAILHRQDLPSALSPLGGAFLWIDRGAELLSGKVGETRTKASFLEGCLAPACATPATQVPPCPSVSGEAGGAFKGAREMETFSYTCPPPQQTIGPTGTYTCPSPAFVSANPCPTVQPCYPTWNCPTHQACQTAQQCPQTPSVLCHTSYPVCPHIPTLQQCPPTWSCPTHQHCPATWNCPRPPSWNCPTLQPNCLPTLQCPTLPVQQCPTVWPCLLQTIVGQCPTVGPQLCPTQITCTP